MKKIFSPLRHKTSASVALLLLRLVVGAAFVLHGYGKIQHPFSWMGDKAGTPGIFQFLAAISEFGGGIAFIVGVITPLAAFGIACTMSVAIYTHITVFKQPFVNPKGTGAYELPAAYLSVAIVLMLLGPGKFSLDRYLFGERS